MAGAGIHHELCARDRRREGLLLAAEKERILIAPDNEGGGCDFAELPEKSVSNRAASAALHTLRWDLQALLHNGIEQGLRHGRASVLC